MATYLSTPRQLRADLHAAMRAWDGQRVAALRLLLAAVHQVEVDLRYRAGLPDEQWVAVFHAEAKKRREAHYHESAQRDDVAAVARYELALVEQYSVPLSEKKKQPR